MNGITDDKWLDGEELKQDEVGRAATMREKYEKLQNDYESLKANYQHLLTVIRLMKMGRDDL